MPENSRNRYRQDIGNSEDSQQNALAVQGTRLNKALADAGVCSRRAADDLIRSGAVCVNGAVVLELGLRVDPLNDAITVNGTPLPRTESGQAVYIMLHKPIQVVSTVRDPEGRATVLELLPDAYRGKRLYPVGRLDFFSEGLLLLTNDGELANRLTHPRYHLPKVYDVLLRQMPSQRDLAILRQGMTLREGERLAPVDAFIIPGDRPRLRLTLRQGVNRQIRRMCRDLGLTILRLTRILLGPLQLGDLPKGKCRHLHKEEVAALKKAVGLQ